MDTETVEQVQARYPDIAEMLKEDTVKNFENDLIQAVNQERLLGYVINEKGQVVFKFGFDDIAETDEGFTVTLARDGFMTKFYHDKVAALIGPSWVYPASVIQEGSMVWLHNQHTEFADPEDKIVLDINYDGAEPRSYALILRFEDLDMINMLPTLAESLALNLAENPLTDTSDENEIESAYRKLLSEYWTILTTAFDQPVEGE